MTKSQGKSLSIILHYDRIPPTFDLHQSLETTSYSYVEIFREMNKLHLIFVSTVYGNFERSYSQKNDFDLLTSSDLDFESRSLKI